MKKAVVLIVLLLVFLPAAAWAENEQYEEETRASIEQGIDDVLGELDLSALEELYGETSLAEEISFSELMEDLTQNGFSAVSVEEILDRVFQEMGRAFRKNILRIAEIAVVLLVTGVLKQLPSDGKGAAQIAAWTGYIVCCGIAVTILVGCFTEVKQALEVLFRIVEVLTPILLVLLTGMGGLTGSSVMSPVMAALTGSIFEIIEQAIFPMLVAGAVFSMASCISSAVRLDKLSDLLGSVVKWALGILFTVFIGICAMKGIAGASIDGVYFKTAKYTIDRMVPVIGGMFSDTLDTIMACSMLVKNSVGFMGLIILAAMMLRPILSLFSTMILFRAGAAVVQPFADGRAVMLMERLGKTAELAFIVVLTCVAMAFISIALLMGAADMSLMMR